MTSTDLKLESEIYAENCDNWVRQGLTGQVVVIKEKKIIGFYASIKQATKAARHLKKPIFRTFITASNAVNALYLESNDESKESR